MNKIFSIIIIITFSFGQNINLYLSLIEQGQVEGVRETLPELISKFPNNPEVRYLKALLCEDCESAINQYTELLKTYPDSKYAPDAAMKIGEYFYAKGLYTQSARLLKNIPITYPRYKEIQRVTNLMINSFNAIGEADSAKYYGLIINSMFPSIETGIKNISSKNKPLGQVFEFNKKKPIYGPYVIQIGAFGSPENAKRMKMQVTQLGHDVSINDVESNGKKLYAVRVNRFKSKKQAERIGKDIKSKLGVEFRVLYRPISK